MNSYLFESEFQFSYAFGLLEQNFGNYGFHQPYYSLRRVTKVKVIICSKICWRYVKSSMWHPMFEIYHPLPELIVLKLLFFNFCTPLQYYAMARRPCIMLQMTPSYYSRFRKEKMEKFLLLRVESASELGHLNKMKSQNYSQDKNIKKKRNIVCSHKFKLLFICTYIFWGTECNKL